MIICHCHVVSDRDIDHAIDDGAGDLCALAARCGAGSRCGGCLPAICELLERRGLEVDPALTVGQIRRRLGLPAAPREVSVSAM